MTKYYIATRLSSNEMYRATGFKLAILNRGLTSTLSSIAMGEGIKKTQAGKSLIFYAVNQEQFDQLTADSAPIMAALKSGIELRPLLAVNGDLLTSSLNSVNAKYSRRMDSKTHATYMKELTDALKAAVVKLNEDKKIERPRATNKHNIKVGDLISVDNGRRSTTVARVTRVTNASYSYQALLMSGYERNFLENDLIKGATGWYDNLYHQEWDLNVPYVGNEHMFYLSEFTVTKRFSTRYDGVKAITPEQAKYRTWRYND